MRLIRATKDQIERIVQLSQAAFESDVYVGGKSGDCPPEYDSVTWHNEMTEKGHLYQAIVDNTVIGAAILFFHEEVKSLYIGRIFIDPKIHRKGYGIDLMKCIETLYADVQEINLDTPVWNKRTNSFYQKLGYTAVKEENGFVFYQKRIQSEIPI